MVPKTVCQKSCSNSALCQQCDKFRQGPGFGSCPTATCGNYVPNYDAGVGGGFANGGGISVVDPGTILK